MVLLLLACAPEPADVPAWPRIGERVEVELLARRGEDETAWVASVAVNPPTPSPKRACGPIAAGRHGVRGFAGMQIEVPAVADLRWVEASGRWEGSGPRASVDPAWAVGSVAWIQEGGTRVTADGAARFGGVAEVRAVSRDEDGSVRVFWDPTEDQVSVVANGMECFGDKTGVRVPWWAVPPAGGEVLVRTARTRMTIVPDLGVVRVRAVIEEVLPLDVPLTTKDVPILEAPTPRERPPRIFRRVGKFG